MRCRALGEHRAPAGSSPGPRQQHSPGYMSQTKSSSCSLPLTLTSSLRPHTTLLALTRMWPWAAWPLANGHSHSQGMERAGLGWALTHVFPGAWTSIQTNLHPE